ncbi:MAG: CocE/NonD family hydrolase [Candidatus Latescibacteria bacterium]|nr:CocE/NonD family hydrolase [Candidatus Latescibacterota bacterium]
MPIEFPPQNGVRFIKNIMIPMSDGVRLAMDLHVPDCEDWAHQSRPLILEYLPYRKDDSAPYSGYHNRFAQHGIIGARIDCRGTGSSEGINTDEYTPQEQADGVEAIEWIAQQPWSTGKIAMFGGSYGGFTAVQIAAHAPPHLTTIIPFFYTDDRYTDDCHYRGGCLRCYYDIGAYGTSVSGRNAFPPYPEYSGDAWADIWEEHLSTNTPYILAWLAHQTDGEYWRPGSIRGRYDQIRCSALLIGGWRDGYPNPPLRTFMNMKAPRKVLIGPWNHRPIELCIPGPRIDYIAEVIRWCDYWLKGEENGVMDGPPVCFYMQGYDDPKVDRLETTGYWRTEPDFPVPGSGEKMLYLSADGALSEAAPSAREAADGYDYRPTVGISGGLWSGGLPFGLPTDQGPDEVYSLNYTSEPLAEPLEILHMPLAVLHVSSTAPVMAFVVRLCDVAPDGTSALVCNGVLNGTRRESLTDPSPMAPGRVYELKISLDSTAWRFEPGHRIRLSVCSADFPNLWPTPYPGAVSLYRDAAHPSRLALPVIPTREKKDQASFPPPSNAVGVYREAPNERPWEIVHDLLGDRTGLRISMKSSARSSETMEVGHTRQLEVWASNRDPSDVSAIGKFFWRIVRADGVTAVDTVCSVRSTETAFHLVFNLDIRVNDVPHHHKRWVQSFPRALL